MLSRVKELVLELLRRYPEGIPQSMIHKLINASKSRVCEVLQELENAGVIIRVKIGKQYLIKLRTAKEVALRRVTKRRLNLGIVWSSEYPFIAPFAKILRSRYGIDLEVSVFPNALLATWALVNGDVDLVLSPLITQLYAYSLTKSLRIIGAGAYGGSVVLENPNAKYDIVASSELSAMDACRSVAIRELINVRNTYYFSKPEDEVMKLLREGRVRYFVVWHPLIDKLSMFGLRRIISCDELGIDYCCTLAASVRIERRLRSLLARVYEEALKEYSRDPSKWFEWYSLKVGIPVDTIKRGQILYKLRPYLDVNTISRMLGRIGISVPSYEIIKEAIETYQ